jgi:hypothetical protein
MAKLFIIPLAVGAYFGHNLYTNAPSYLNNQNNSSCQRLVSCSADSSGQRPVSCSANSTNSTLLQKSGPQQFFRRFQFTNPTQKQMFYRYGKLSSIGLLVGPAVCIVGGIHAHYKGPDYTTMAVLVPICLWISAMIAVGMCSIGALVMFARILRKYF